METLNYFTFLLLPFFWWGEELGWVTKGRTDRRYIKLEAHWKLSSQFAQTLPTWWGHSNNDQAECIISCFSLYYWGSRQRQSLQPDTMTPCAALLLFCQTPRSQGGAATAWSGPVTDVLQALQCPNCAGSLVSWEGMSLFSLLDCFRVFGRLLLFLRMLQYEKPLQYLLTYFSLSKLEPKHVPGSGTQIGVIDSYSESTCPSVDMLPSQFIVPSSMSPWNKWPTIHEVFQTPCKLTWQTSFAKSWMTVHLQTHHSLSNEASNSHTNIFWLVHLSAPPDMARHTWLSAVDTT